MASNGFRLRLISTIILAASLPLVLFDLATSAVQKDAYRLMFACLFLLLGCVWQLWGVAWVLFLLIPLYYPVVHWFDRRYRRRRERAGIIDIEPDDDDDDDED